MVAVNIRDTSIEEIKNSIIRKSIALKKNMYIKDEIKENHKKQVRQLFKGSN